MKKRLAVALAAVMVAGSLAGCAGSGTTAAPETKAETQAKAGESETEKKAEEKTEEKTEEKAGGQAADTEKTMMIGVIPKSTLFDFYKMVRQGAEDAAAEHGYTINYQGTNSSTDTATQQNIVEDMMMSGIDALVISSIDAKAINDTMASLDVPVITFDDEMDPSVCLTTVSVNHEAAAAAGAAYIAEKLPEGGKVAVVSSEAGSDVIQQRDRGFENELKKHDQFELVGIYHTEGDREKAANIMQDLLSEHPDLVAVFCCNEGASAGASKMLKDEGRTDILAVGYDSSEELINNIYDGSLDALISQNPYGLGYNSVKAAIEAIDGKNDFPDVTESPYWLIDADNIHDPEVIKILDPLGTLNLK